MSVPYSYTESTTDVLINIVTIILVFNFLVEIDMLFILNYTLRPVGSATWTGILKERRHDMDLMQLEDDSFLDKGPCTWLIGAELHLGYLQQ